MLQTILIVDDEPQFLQPLSCALRNEGYVVETASDGLEAVNKAQQVRPALILLDLMMPKLDGTAVCEILRQFPSTASVPILMLTGCSTDSTKLIALNAGVDDYMTKPFELQDLIARIRQMLAQKGSCHN